MPIECPLQFPHLDRETFRRLDYQVMKLAFETHADLGISCDEKIYHNDLAARLNETDLNSSLVEMPIRVRHGSFMKEYRVDLVVANQAIYELKAAREITTSHETQAMNYLLLADCRHGKIVNFGGTSVESRFVNNPVTREERHRFEKRIASWHGPDTLLNALIGFVQDVGLFLEATLYNQVLAHHLGGPDRVLEQRPLELQGRHLGNHCFQMCSPDEAFRVTTLTHRLRSQRTSFEKLLSLSDLKAMHWINLNHHQIDFVTLRR